MSTRANSIRRLAEAAAPLYQGLDQAKAFFHHRTRFHGIHTSRLRIQAGSVTDVSGTECHLCLRPRKRYPAALERVRIEPDRHAWLKSGGIPLRIEA